jgi:tetrahydromethanopterin S-methyltransferase subunit H
MKNDPVPNLTGSYLSTGMEIDESEDIIFNTI